MISPRAIEQFLEREPPPFIDVRGKDVAWLHDVVRRATGHELRFKTPWLGGDRDQRQLEAIVFALLHKRVLLHYAPRTGKTRISLDWLTHLRRAGWVTEKTLAVAHAPIGVEEWELQIPVHSDLRAACVRSGPDSAEHFLQACESDAEIVVTTWSTLQQIFGEKREARKQPKTRVKSEPKMKIYADRVSARLAAGYFQALVVDEIHKVMDPSSLRFAIISELGSATDWRLGLTGTPFGRDPFALWAQSFIVDGGEALGRNFFFFQHAFGKTKYNHHKRSKYEYVFDSKKMPLLRQKLAHMSLHCRLEDIQDVNVMQAPVRLPMSPRQSEAYYELVEGLVRDIKEGDARATENVFVRLRQVSSGFRPFEDENDERHIVEFSDASKYQWLEEFFRDLDPDLRVVIFHEFIPTGRRISRLLDEMKIRHRWLWGGTKDKRGAYMDFREGRVPHLVANHAAGGTALDLSVAHYMCVFESPVGVIAREQMLARPMARGARPLVVDDLVCSSVEEKILAFHSEGRSLMELFRRPRDLARALSR